MPNLTETAVSSTPESRLPDRAIRLLTAPPPLADLLEREAVSVRARGTQADEWVAQTLELIARDVRDHRARTPEEYWGRVCAMARVELIEAHADRAGRHPLTDDDGEDFS